MSQADKATSRELFLSAQDTLGLGSVDMAKVVIGTKNGYNNYKQWIIDSPNSRNPSLAVVAHVKALLSWHELSPGTLRTHINKILKSLS
jgi:hypothetical protein